MRICPLCHQPLTKQSAQDIGGWEEDWYCEEEIQFPNDPRKFNHYREFTSLGYLDMYIAPYRIRSRDHDSKIGLHSQYKIRRGGPGIDKFYFKTLIQCPKIHPDSADKLRNRIKLLLLIS